MDKEIKPSRWGRIVKYGAYTIGAATIIALFPKYGLYNQYLKNQEINSITAPLRTEVQSLEEKRRRLEERAGRLTQEKDKLIIEKDLAVYHAKGTGKAAAEAIVRSVDVEERVRAEYNDGLFAAYQTQFSKHPAEIKDFVYNFEKGEEGRVYFDIKPVSEKTLKEVVEVVIPENYRERKELALAIPGFFDRYHSLARKNGLSGRLTDYASIDATPQANGVWNLTFVTRDGKEKGVKYYPGRD